LVTVFGNCVRRNREEDASLFLHQNRFDSSSHGTSLLFSKGEYNRGKPKTPHARTFLVSTERFLFSFRRFFEDFVREQFQ